MDYSRRKLIILYIRGQLVVFLEQVFPNVFLDSLPLTHILRCEVAPFGGRANSSQPHAAAALMPL